MAVPRKKVSPSRRGKRRGGHLRPPITYIEDKESGALRRPHHMDLSTGLYRGREILKPKEKPAEDA